MPGSAIVCLALVGAPFDRAPQPACPDCPSLLPAVLRPALQAAPQPGLAAPAPEAPVPGFSGVLRRALALILDLDRSLLLVVWTSLFTSLLAVLIASCLAVPLGLLVGLTLFPGRRLVLGILNTLMALPTVLIGLVLYGLLSRHGPLGHHGLLYTPAAIIIGQSLLILPIVWNLSIAAVSGADARLQLVCRSLGASFRQQAVVYMREVRFALMAAVVMGFGRAIGEVGVAMMAGGNIAGYTRTMTTTIALETSKGELEFACALGMLLLLVAFVVNLLLQQFQEVDR